MSTTIQSIKQDVEQLREQVENDAYEVTVADLESLIAKLNDVDDGGSTTQGSGGPGEEPTGP